MKAQKQKFNWNIVFVGWIVLYAVWLILQGALPIVYGYELSPIESSLAYFIAATWFLVLIVSEVSSRSWIRQLTDLSKEILEDWRRTTKWYEARLNDPEYLRKRLNELEQNGTESGKTDTE